MFGIVVSSEVIDFISHREAVSMSDYMVAAGIDVGNGYVKAKVQVGANAPRVLDLPSCVTYLSASSWIPSDATDAYMADLVNELDCDVMSDAVAPSDRRRILVGRRAAASGRVPVMFDINDARPKCDDSLSGQLVCSAIVAAVLGQIWTDTGELPEAAVNVKAYVALALPISDYAANRERYAHMFTEGNHTVHVHNFEREITVNISFADVYVLPEGAAAQYAITQMGPKFLEAVIQEARDNGIPCEGETAATLLSYSNTIGVDIGEGTVNFPVFRDGRVNVEASSSINRGYGTVLSDVVEQTRGSGYAPDSRKELAEFMLKKDPTPRDRRIMAKLQHVIDDEADVFARDIIGEYTRVLRRTKLVADVVYVYGGGADAVRSVLWPRLVEASKLDDDIYTPVMYLSSDVSRHLNRDGLFAVALARASKSA